MKIFKEVITILCSPVATFGFGWAIVDLFTGDYKSAAWGFFAVSIIFMLGYWTKRWTNEDF